MLRSASVLLLCGVALAVAPSAAFGQAAPGTGSPASGTVPGMTNMSPAASTASSAMNGMDQQDSSLGAGPDVQAMRDKMFLRMGAEAALAQIELGQLAASKGTGEGVKHLARRMVADGTALQASLMPLLTARHLKLPANGGKGALAEADRLNRLSGPSFDQEYLLYSRREYGVRQELFHRERATTDDPELQDVALQAEQVSGRREYFVQRLCAQTGVDTAVARR